MMPSPQAAIIVFILSVLLGALYTPLESNTSFTTRDSAGNFHQAKNVLLITAHPDDEAMFFAPTILSLNPRPDISFFHLCLSTGNADGIGKTRQSELGYSLDILGVPKPKRWLIDHPDLQDDMTVQWDSEIIANAILPYVSALKIDTILTFDSHGVSGHPNHKAIPAGVKSLIKTLNSTSPSTTPRLFSLISVSLLTKYLGFAAVAVAKVELFVYNGTKKLSSVLAYGIGLNILDHEDEISVPVMVSNFDQYMTAFSAMLAHYSQLVWFRWLYIGWSRYMWTNSWEEVRIIVE